MSIKTRFALLLGLLLLGFIFSWLVLQRAERREAEEIMARARTERTQMLNHWIDFQARALPQFAAEYAQSEEFSGATTEQISPAIRDKIADAVAKAGLQVLWVIRADGSPSLEIEAAGKKSSTGLPPPPGKLALLPDTVSTLHFFSEQGQEFWELSARRIDQANVASGWIVIARRWDEPYLKALASITDSAVSLVGTIRPPTATPSSDSVVVFRPLLDERGREIRLLRAEHRDLELQHRLRADLRPVRVFIAFAILVIVTLALALQMWVLRPLGRIGDSLARSDPSLLGKLSREKTELGRVAQLVEFSSAQTNALKHNEEVLRRTMDERARLGWDLHDGVIQALYAAGMGLTGVRSLLQPDQEMAAGRLEQVRGILNETIRDIRNFITGLEPQALKEQSFTQAVSNLLGTMQAIRPLRTTIEIDDAFAARLSLAQRVHALQIVREAVSNALRHGEASHVSVTLRAGKEIAEFEICDDGRGFDPAILSDGNGLANLAERARELGAQLDMQSAHGKGTRVKLTFHLRSLS